MSGKLSILISCYNQRDFIGQAIRSFFEQDYENREIIVLDDGSSDDSMAVIASAAAEAPCPVLQQQLKHRVRCYTSLKAITGYHIRSGVWRKWHPEII